MDQNALDDLFERNADMRLLERRHQEVTATTTDGASRRVGGGFGAESIVPGAAGEIAMEDSARLRVEIAAAPQTGVIPGAVVGVAVDVFNDGTAPAPEATLQLSLPIESQFRDGSLRLDGKEVPAPERLFATGLPLPRLLAESSLKVTFQLAVLPGVSALILQPQLRAEGVPVVGTVGCAIKRGTMSTTAAVAQAPSRPFYELEEDEIDEVAASADTAQPILPPVIAAAAAEVLELPLEIEPEPEPLPEPVPEPEPARAVAPEPTAEPADVRPARYRAIGTPDVARLERLFAAERPGPLAHLITITTLACSQAADGSDLGTFDASVRRNGETLARALVLERLGKPTSTLVPPDQLDAIDADAARPVPGAAPRQPVLRRLARATDAPALASLVRSSDRDPTIRFHLALLALGAEAIDGLDKPAHSSDCGVMLVSYRANALAWLGPACIASAGRPGLPLPDPPAALDAAGRRLLTALKTALG